MNSKIILTLKMPIRKILQASNPVCGAASRYTAYYHTIRTEALICEAVRKADVKGKALIVIPTTQR